MVNHKHNYIYNIHESIILSEETQKIIHTLQELQTSEDSLSTLAKQGIIADVGTAIVEMLKRKFKLKEDFVMKVHKNKISEITVNKNGTMTTVYQTRMPDKTRPRFISYEGIICHLFDYYTSHGYDPDPYRPPEKEDYSLGAMFEKALEDRIRREKPKERTVRDYRYTYEKYITDDFSACDIRMITPSQCDTYIQEQLQAITTSEKGLLKFKGVLNLVFSYSMDLQSSFLRLSVFESVSFLP